MTMIVVNRLLLRIAMIELAGLLRAEKEVVVNKGLGHEGD
jgi:hypothetical protein